MKVWSEGALLGDHCATTDLAEVTASARRYEIQEAEKSNCVSGSFVCRGGQLLLTDPER